MANDTATVTQTVNSVTVDPPSQSSLTVTSTSGGALTLSESTASLTAVTVSPLSASLTIESNFAPKESPNFTGIPTAPTASAGTNTTQIATTAFVNSAITLENTLAEMDDANFTSLGNNEILQYDTSSSKWLNQTLSEAGIASTSSLSAHTSATNNPHSVTATQVNLGNVTNESKGTMFTTPTFTGQITHSGVILTAGTSIDQVKTSVVSMTVTPTFQDTNITQSGAMPTGTYVMLLHVNDAAGGGSAEAYYSAIINIYGGTTSADDFSSEVDLHRSGGSDNGKMIFIRTRSEADTNNVRIEMAANFTASNTSNYTFKFRRLI